MTTNSENRQRVRMFTLEEVIEKVINIDSDNESLANAVELIFHSHASVMLAQIMRMMKMLLLK